MSSILNMVSLYFLSNIYIEVCSRMYRVYTDLEVREKGLDQKYKFEGR